MPPANAAAICRVLGLAALSLLAACAARLDELRPVPLPDYPTPARTLWLDQGWDPNDRTWYHHASQGTSTFGIPYEWFMALEWPEPSFGSPGLLSDPARLRRFGFIPGHRHPGHNPDGLPVGFARGGARTDPVTGEVWRNPATGRPLTEIGFTCAACHTGQIDHGDVAILIDGAPALIDLGKFRGVLARAVGYTAVSPPRFARFADRVLGRGHDADAAATLRAQLLNVFEGIKQVAAREHANRERSRGEGFGRLDALNRIGNELFAEQLGRPDNHHPESAPVAFPHLWATPWFDWVQYNGAIEQPLVRNAGQALGVRALVNLTRKDGLFASTINFDNLHRMETQLAGKSPWPQPAGGSPEQRFSGLKAPVWPESVLPGIDGKKAAHGRRLYRELCQECHQPPVGEAAFWDAARWTRANAAGERYYKVPMIPIDVVGTDPAQAATLAARTVRVPKTLGLSGGAGEGPDAVHAFGPALGELVEKVAGAWYDSHRPPLSPARRDRLNGHRANGIRAPFAYKARPLDGIWATAPYLHNGSVPDLYALLSPIGERPVTFHLGNRAFDPVRVGYRTEPVAGGFELDTTEPGNRNTGHEFDDGPPRAGLIGRRLEHDERMALIEYLKTL